MVDNFYKPFHVKVEDTLEKSEKSKGERLLGVDPESDRDVYVKIGRYGPVAQIGHPDDDEKPRFAALLKNQHLDSITLEEALDLFKLPKTVGEFENEDIVAGVGRYGPYLRHKGKFFSLGKSHDPLSVDLNTSIEIIKEKRNKDKEKIIQTFEEKDISVLNGRYGPYISHKKKNYRIPKKTDPKKLTIDDCLEIIEKSASKKKSRS